MSRFVSGPDVNEPGIGVEASRHIIATRAFWSGLDAAAGPISSLLMTVGLIRSLGASDYGALLVVLAASNISMAINPAIAATTIKYVSESAGREPTDGAAAARIVSASVLVVAIVGVLFLILVIVCGTQISHLLFGHGTLRDSADPSHVLVLAAVAMAMQQLDGVFAAAIKGYERFRQQGLFEVCSRFATVGFVTMVGWQTHRLSTVLSAHACMLAISAVLRALLLRTLTNDRHIFCLPQRSDLKRILSFGGWMWLNATATTAYGTVDKIIVARFLGSGAAAEFHIYVQLSQLVHYIPSSLFAFSFPAFSRFSASGVAGKQPARQLYRKVLFLGAGLALAIAVGLVSFRHELLAMLVGSSLAVGEVVAFNYLIVGFTLLSFGIAPYYLLLGQGRSRIVSFFTSSSMLVATAMLPYFVHRYGVEGAAIARLIYPIGTLTLLVVAMRAVER